MLDAGATLVEPNSMDTRPNIPDGIENLTANWMDQALSVGGLLTVPRVQDVLLEEIGVGVGMVGKLLRCHLTYRSGDSNGPETVIVKMPSEHPETLETARRLRLYQREYAFYRRLASRVPVRSPALLYGDFDDSSNRFVLVLEDLGHLTNPDQVDGASAEQAKTAVRAAAMLHGHFWNRVDRPPLSGFHQSATPERQALVQRVYQDSLGPALERFGHVFNAPMRRLAEEFGSEMVGYLEAVAAGPLAFTHGDFRLDNMFFGGDDTDFAVVDWQVSGVASGLSDVAYFLSSSVTPEIRRAIEQEALAEYHDIIRRSGVDEYSLEDCWRSYRQNMLGCFRTPIIAGGQLDFGNHRSRQLAETFLHRTLTAIDDLDVRDFLPGSSPRSGPR